MRSVVQLSILLKSYWNKVYVTKDPLNLKAFNSFEVLLEPQKKQPFQVLHKLLSILLKSYWNSMMYSSAIPAETNLSILLKSYWNTGETPYFLLHNILSILLKSYWNEDRELAEAIRDLTFNSSEVLLERSCRERRGVAKGLSILLKSYWNTFIEDHFDRFWAGSNFQFF